MTIMFKFKIRLKYAETNNASQYVVQLIVVWQAAVREGTELVWTTVDCGEDKDTAFAKRYPVYNKENEILPLTTCNGVSKFATHNHLGEPLSSL